MRTVLVSVLALTAALLISREATSGGNKNKAKDLTEQGQKLFDDGQFKEASAKLKQAYEINKDYNLLYDIAKAEAADKNYSEAFRYYHLFLSEGGAKVSFGQRSEVQKEIKRLEALAPQPETKDAPPAAPPPTAPPPAAPQPGFQQPAAPPPAPPQPSPKDLKMQEANQHFQQGLTLQQRGELELAKIEFQTSYSISPNYNAMCSLGQVQAKLGQNAEARASLVRCLNEGGTLIPPTTRNLIDRDIARLDEEAAQSKKKKEAQAICDKGRALFAQGKYPRAKSSFEKAYATYPDPEFLYELGKAEAQMGNEREALENYRRYLDSAGTSISELKRDDVKRQMDNLNRALEAAAAKAQAKDLVADGQGLYKAGEYEAAVDRYKEAYKLDSNFEIMYFQAQAQAGAKAYRDAIDSYERYLSEGGANVKKGQQKKVQKEIEGLKKLAKEEDDRNQSLELYKKGVALNKKERFEEGMSELEAAYKLYPDYRILHAIGDSAAGLERFDLAIDAYNRYLKEGKNELTPDKRADAEREIEELKEAKDKKERKERSLELFKSGLELSKQGDNEKALAELERAYEIYSSYKILYSIGKTQALLQKNAEAIESYNRYLNDGGSKISSKKRTYVESQITRLTAAEERRVKEDESRAHLEAGLKLKSKGRLEQAANEFKTAYELNPDYEILLHMAETDAKLKNHEGALKNYSLYLTKGGGKIPEEKRAKIKKEMDRLYKLVKQNKAGG